MSRHRLRDERARLTGVATLFSPLERSRMVHAMRTMYELTERPVAIATVSIIFSVLFYFHAYVCDDAFCCSRWVWRASTGSAPR